MLAVDVIVHAVTELELPAPAPKARSTVQRLSYANENNTSNSASSSGSTLMLSFALFGEGAMDTIHYSCPYSPKSGSSRRGGVTSMIEGRSSCELLLSALRNKGGSTIEVLLRSRAFACAYRGSVALDLSFSVSSDERGESLEDVAVARSAEHRLRLDAPGDKSCWLDCSVAVYDLERLRIPATVIAAPAEPQQQHDESIEGNSANASNALGDLLLSVAASQGSLQAMIQTVEAQSLHRGKSDNRGSGRDDISNNSDTTLSVDGILLECEEARMRALFDAQGRRSAAARRTLRYGSARSKNAVPAAVEAAAEPLRHTPYLSRVARVRVAPPSQASPSGKQQQSSAGVEGGVAGREPLADLLRLPVHAPEVRPLVYYHR